MGAVGSEATPDTFVRIKEVILHTLKNLIQMKSPLTCLLLFFFLLTGKAQTRQDISYFPLQDVKLLDSPFLQAQQTDLHYIMAMNPDRLLAPFLREAGLTPKAPSYTNWENT